MKRDIPTQAGIGFTIVVAAATLAVAVVAGIFLIYQSEMNLTLDTRPVVEAQMSAEAADLQQRSRTVAPRSSP